jgi:hypothetical protein
VSDFIIFDEGAELLLHGRKLGSRILRDLAPAELLGAIWDGEVYEHRGILLPRISGGADFIGFNEGRQVVEDTGWPATVTFDLSTLAVSGLAATTVYSGRTPITGTGYTNKTQAEPAATGLGGKTFTVLTWATGAATNWTNPCTIIASDGTKIICAWNLVAGGAARDMSQANTTLNVTPTYLPTNPP